MEPQSNTREAVILAFAPDGTTYDELALAIKRLGVIVQAQWEAFYELMVAPTLEWVGEMIREYRSTPRRKPIITPYPYNWKQFSMVRNTRHYRRGAYV